MRFSELFLWLTVSLAGACSDAIAQTTIDNTTTPDPTTSARYAVARVDEPRLGTKEQPGGLLPGWKAFALMPGEQVRHPVLRWDSPPEFDSGTAYLRIAIAVDDRQARSVEAVFDQTGELAGTFDVRYASPFQSFEAALSPAAARRAVKEGIRLQLTGGDKPLWILWQHDGKDAGAEALLPHLMQVGDFDPMDEFARRLCSVASLQQFSWMGGCVLDGLWALGDSWRGQRPRLAVRRQVDLYLAGGGREGLWVEGTLPYATVARVNPEHPILPDAIDFLLSRRDAEGCIVAGTTTTAEGNYTVAYPLAVLAGAWNRPDLEEVAIEQLRLRTARLVDDDGNPWLRHHAGGRDPSRTFPGWSRGVAWYALGLARTLAELEHRDDVDDLKAELRRVCAWAQEHQRPDGLWGVFVAEPELTADSAGSAGIAAALAWAARHGWADPSCLDSAEKAHVTLQSLLTPDGFLTGMSQSNKREAGIQLQRSNYRVNCQTAMGLMAQLIAALQP